MRDLPCRAGGFTEAVIEVTEVIANRLIDDVALIRIEAFYDLGQAGPICRRDTFKRVFKGRIIVEIHR
jgi:hypothetical protein